MLGVAALILAALLSTIGILTTAFGSFRTFETGNDDVSIWTARLEELRANLPPEESILGYLTESDVPGVTYDPIDHDEEFVMTQYALAPFIVQHGTQPTYVIGNFANPAVTISAVESMFDLKLVKDYSMGIFLLKRAAP